VTCGGAYPDPVTGQYPSINNSGFVAAYRAKGASDPGRIMKCSSPTQVSILTTLAQEFAICDRWFSSMPGPTWPNRFFIHAASSGGLDDSPSGFESATSELIDGYRFWNGTIFDRLEDRCLDWEIFEGDEFPQVFSISGMDLYALDGKFTDFEDFVGRLNESHYSPVYIFIEPNYGNDCPPPVKISPAATPNILSTM
jgi:phospholipase C